MTREEAAQFLDNIKDQELGRAIGASEYYARLIGYHVQALNIAIDALDEGSILDNIRAEIMSLSDGDVPEQIWNVDVLEIIDKYKKEEKE